MKKIIFILIFGVSLIRADCYPSCTGLWTLLLDGSLAAYEGYFKEIKELNGVLEDIYKDIRDNEVASILTEIENKSTILNNIKTLSKDDALTKAEQVFLLDSKKELKGILIDTWSEE